MSTIAIQFPRGYEAMGRPADEIVTNFMDVEPDEFDAEVAAYSTWAKVITDADELAALDVPLPEDRAPVDFGPPVLGPSIRRVFTEDMPKDELVTEAKRLDVKATGNRSQLVAAINAANESDE